jgi:hypothetical protein
MVFNHFIMNRYKIFSKHSFKSKYIKLTKEFIDFLNEDSIIIPNLDEYEEKEYKYKNMKIEENFDNEENKFDKEFLIEKTNFDEKENNTKELLIEIKEELKNIEKKNENEKKFPEILNFMKDTINEFGFVFPKLNWSAPIDSTWILPYENKLKCNTIHELLLTLKSSELLNYDLDLCYSFIEENIKENNSEENINEINMKENLNNKENINFNESENDIKNENNENNENIKENINEKINENKQLDKILVLKQYYKLDPSMEFRLFIKNNNIVGIY